MPGSVAVVIPCFNDGGTLEAAVTSVQDQDVPAEIIVVDDGATDSTTIAAYERLQSAGVRIIHQVNQGPAPARMTGVRAAGADYVFALDADDLVAAGGLRRLKDVLDRHPRRPQRGDRYGASGRSSTAVIELETAWIRGRSRIRTTFR
jgi:glycosyltransferase involved in cell wall biosynthesis